MNMGLLYAYIKYVCICCKFLAASLMPEHSLSPSQTLETAWPVTRRFTKLWLKTQTIHETAVIHYPVLVKSDLLPITILHLINKNRRRGVYTCHGHALGL